MERVVFVRLGAALSIKFIKITTTCLQLTDGMDALNWELLHAIYRWFAKTAQKCVHTHIFCKSAWIS